MTDDLKTPERIWAWEQIERGIPSGAGDWMTHQTGCTVEYVRADRIATLEAALADMTRQRDAAMAGAVKVKPLVWQDFANIEAGPIGMHGDNLAVTLCSYFDGHMSCPDDGEDGSELDEYDCWKVWVSENAEDVLRRIARAANASILSALTPDTDRMLALTAAAEAQAEARGMRKAADRAQEIANAAREVGLTLKRGSKAQIEIMERCWGAEDARVAIFALADATEAAAKGVV